MGVLAWLETTAVAQSIGASLYLTASLSAVHLLGFTLIMGGALATNLRLVGALFPDSRLRDVSRPASRAILLGLAISIVTGLLLFAPRAVGTMASGTFQLKVSLLLAATALHFIVVYRPSPRLDTSLPLQRAIGALGVGAWLALAVVACWFILFE